jgi:hypothetical protein
MPTRVSHNTPALGNWSSSATPKTTAPFAVSAGDLIVVAADSSQAGTHAGVTPSASGGSVTWTARVAVAVSGTGQCGAWVWTGAVAAADPLLTVTLARPTTSNVPWGFSATVWRDHGGVGAVFDASSSSVVAPQASATCSAGSAVQGIVADWWCSDGSSRVWRTINGAAITEATYYFDAFSHVVYEGHRLDVGSAGSKTFGLTAPNMKYSLAGVEILAGSGGADPGAGSATGATTWTGSATGARSPVGTGAGSTGWTGAATGARSPAATGAGATAWSGAAAGVRSPVAVALGAFVWAGSAVGAAPLVDGAAGTASGATVWVGTAVGERAPKGVAVGAVEWVGAATGTTTRTGAATGTTTWAGSAFGTTADLEAPPGRTTTVPPVSRVSTVSATTRTATVPTANRTEKR